MTGPMDSAARRKGNERVRSRFGTSQSGFKSKFELLEDLDTTSGRGAQLKVTVLRQSLERELEIAATWAQTWRLETGAARLKLARLNSVKPGVRNRIAAQLEVARCGKEEE